MSFAIVRLGAVVAVLATGLAVPCFAADPLGTAGPVRSAGENTCNGDVAAAARGECDPPSVDLAIPVERRSQARIERARLLVSLLRTEQAVQESPGDPGPEALLQRILAAERDTTTK